MTIYRLLGKDKGHLRYFLNNPHQHQTIMSDLESTKKRLSDTLRDRMQKYWDLMKDWYKRKVSYMGNDNNKSA